ncbi:metallophosphoesterase [Metabacillus fastidiosus]|uniref:metallophosphoesterase n=1 Tax=Metabacillus fastidiosus TaxID=1458 RepID=UPI002E210BC9|nr:metallophosphoesterase [Metabacillus fastidiosus]
MVYFLLGFILILVFYRAYKNTKKIKVNRVSLRKSETENSKKQLTILHLSDIHLENISISPKELSSIIGNKTIDMIALTGDFLDRKRSIPKLIPYLEELNKLNPKYGMYAVFGNHDYFLRENNFEKLKNTLEEYGCKTLQNERITLKINGENINIIGIDDYSTNRSDIERSYKELPNGYNLVLTHDPNIVLEMKNKPFDYLLSGHFHGGQIHWPKPYHLIKMGKLVRMNMVKGLHYHEGKPFYISEGLGQTGVNIRVGSRPEITFHEVS